MIETVAKNLDGEVALDAADQLIQTHRHGLREAVRHPRHALLQSSLHLLLNVRLGDTGSPLGLRLQHHEHLGTIDAGRVARHLGAAYLAQDGRHLRCQAHDTFELALHGQ